MHKALITGGAGTVGQIIAPAFESDIYDIVNGDDIWDTQKLIERIKGKDLVVHLAAYPRFIEGMSEIEFIKLNFGGIVQVVSCMRRAGVRKILFSSSGAAYGIEKDRFGIKEGKHSALYLPIDETYPRSPEEFLTIYGKTKLACEDYLLAQGDLKGYSFRLEAPRVIETEGILSEEHFFAHISEENLLEFMKCLANYDGMPDIFNVGDPTTNHFCPDTIAYAKKHFTTKIRMKSPTDPLYSVKKARELLGYKGRAVI